MALPLPIPPCANRDGLSGLSCEHFDYASTMATTLLAPVKTERQILEHSMSEDDPNANIQLPSVVGKQPRWGPRHRGAQELAELYSPVYFLLEIMIIQSKPFITTPFTTTYRLLRLDCIVLSEFLVNYSYVFVIAYNDYRGYRRQLHGLFDVVVSGFDCLFKVYHSTAVLQNYISKVELKQRKVKSAPAKSSKKAGTSPFRETV